MKLLLLFLIPAMCWGCCDCKVSKPAIGLTHQQIADAEKPYPNLTQDRYVSFGTHYDYKQNMVGLSFTVMVDGKIMMTCFDMYDAPGIVIELDQVEIMKDFIQKRVNDEMPILVKIRKQMQ